MVDESQFNDKLGFFQTLACPKCQNIIDFRLIYIGRSLDDVEKMFQGQQRYVYKNQTFFFHNVVIHYRKRDQWADVSQQYNGYMCPSCRTFLSSYEKKSFATNFEKILNEDQQSIWAIIKTDDDAALKLEYYLRSHPNDFIITLEDQALKRWVYTVEDYPYRSAIQKLIEWVIQSWRELIQCQLDQIIYNPERVIEKVKMNEPLNYIDLNHPSLRSFVSLFEERCKNIHNESKTTLFTKLKTLDVSIGRHTLLL